MSTYKELLTLFYNAKIYQSGREDQTWLTFHNGNGFIIDVGKHNPPVDQFPEERRKDCDGRRILPGLHDSHLHVLKYGQTLTDLNVKDCDSIEDFQKRISDYVELNPEKKWIVGRGWEQDRMGRFPTKEDIDQICRAVPVFLNRICGHFAVVNSLALSIAGIKVDMVDPPGGIIEKYPSNHNHAGEMTGLLIENAIDLIKPFVQQTHDEKKKAIRDAIDSLLENGVTSAHACEDDCWKEYCSLSEEGFLPMRIFFSAYFYDRNQDNFPAYGEKHGTMLSCDRVKLFVDGALGVSTAALSQPYCHSTCNKGILIYSEDNLRNLIHEATALGFRLEIHVIGDYAAELALNALETVKVSPEKRPIFTHCQILRKDLLDRMKVNGIVANIQPQFLTTDARWLSQQLPSGLMQHAYAWKSLLDEGIPCAGGSDAPVEQPVALLGIYDAVFRKVNSRDAANTDVFRPDQCLSIEEAIDLYTKGGAFATMKEHELGQLLPGYQADLVILEKDICSSPADLLQCKVLEVWVAGQRKFLMHT